MAPVGAYLIAFSVTVLIEVPAYLLGLLALHRLGGPTGVRRRLPVGAAVLIVVGLNVITHPLLWWLFSSGYGWSRSAGALPAAELLVAVVEASLLFAALRRDPGWLLLVAIGANAASFGVGLLIRLASVWTGWS